MESDAGQVARGRALIMHPYDVILSILRSGIIQRPRVLLLQRGVVMNVFASDDVDAVQAAVERLLYVNGSDVTIYAVDERLPAPVRGEQVHNILLRGWVEIGQHSLTEHA
jgi:hypothetical protein